MSRIDNVADYIIKELKRNDVIIHRYDSYSTNSVYLKLDYGAAHSIRISDHIGKEHLKYKYNVVPKGVNGWVKDGMFWRYYCNIKENRYIDRMLKIIVDDRLLKIITYGRHRYDTEMKKFKLESADKPGFWDKCFEV